MFVPVLSAAIVMALTPSYAAAYIGPGGGLSLLPMALAMLTAFSVSVVVVITWPVRALRRWLRQRREKKTGQADDGEGHEPDRR